VEESFIDVIVCEPTCSEERPCVTKCCDLDEVWDISSYPHVKCSPAGDNLWNPRVFFSAYDTISLNDSRIIPHIITHHPREWYAGSLSIEALRDVANDKRRL
jgi:hypothetical protein